MCIFTKVQVVVSGGQRVYSFSEIPSPQRTGEQSYFLPLSTNCMMGTGEFPEIPEFEHQEVTSSMGTNQHFPRTTEHCDVSTHMQVFLAILYSSSSSLKS